ncbi:MAG TPA: SUMF1/EgtB/PvdO family nonheme iron enzyme [Sedimentisphaerales bacterium]|nr:SUMF1/EgtB/PvdO family nonheme iron enzyme [Sedimentisphaerales bacterium]
MASFGRYETVRELHRTGFTVVYSGRDAAGQAEEFAIKAFQPSLLLLAEERVKAESELFLSSARAQQKVASGERKHWAPVHECGLTDEGAFYVSDQYSRSLQQLIDVRIRLDAWALHAVIESVVRGLIELKEGCGRPHGNLKPTNVLIAGAGDISETTIVLSDPLPDEHIDNKQHWDSDLRAIGEFIYQLVVQRSLPAIEGWQAPESKEWASLGKQSNDWRDLCNRLLSASVRPGILTVDNLIEELGHLKKAKPVVSPRRLIMAGVVVAVLIIGAVSVPPVRVYIKNLFIPPPPPERAEWETLCTEYMQWVDGLSRELGLPRGNSRADKWGKDAHLKSVLEKIKDASYPYKVVVHQGRASVSEIIHQPEYAEQKDTQKALEAIKDIKNFFDPNSEKAWPVLAGIGKAANAFRQQGWQGPAAYLENLVDKVRPGEGKEIAKNVDALLELPETVNNINSQWDKIKADKEIIVASDDPILARFDDYLGKEVASGAVEVGQVDINELLKKLGDIAGLTGRLAQFIGTDWAQVDKELFKRDPARSGLTASREGFENWLTLAAAFRRIKDPREDIAKEREKVVEQTKYNIQILQEEPTTKSIAEDLRVKLEQIEDHFQKMPEILAGEGIFFIARDEKVIQEKLASCTVELRSVSTEADVEVSKLVPPAEWLAKVEKWQIAGSRAVDAAWAGRRDNILDRDTKTKLTQGDRRTLAAVRRKVEETWDRLEKLDNVARTLERNCADALPIPEDHTININSELKSGYIEEREKVFESIVGKFPQDEVPDVNDPGTFNQPWRQELAAFRGYSDDLNTLVKTFYEVHKRFKAYYLLDDSPTAGSVGTFSELYNKLKTAGAFANIFAENSPTNRVLQELTGRIEALKRIEQENDRQELANTAESVTHPEAVFAAWLRLGRLSGPAWPNGTQDLKKDRDIRSRLKKEFETIRARDETRADSLLEVLARAAVEREAVFVESNSSGDKILGRFRTVTDKSIGAITGTLPEGMEGALKQLDNLEGFARNLADFLAGEDWQNNKIRRDLFFAESSVHTSDAPVTNETFEQWLRQVGLYRELDQDPRKKYPWEAKISEITQLIENELGGKQADSSEQKPAKPKFPWDAGMSKIGGLIKNGLGGKLTGPSKENLAKLEQEYAKLGETVRDVNAMLALPAIEKNRDRIDANICNRFWETLLAHEAAVRSIIKPGYCERLELLEGKVQRLVFAGTTNLSANFEPVNINRLQSVTDGKEKKTPLEAITKFVQGSASAVIGMLGRLPPSEVGKLLEKTVEVAGWDQIRQAVDDKQIEWLDFFHTVDLNNAKNVGWPKYVVSKKDPSVILRLIPAGPGNPEPFYMAAHEISNAQYRRFLQETGAKNATKLRGWAWFKDQSNAELIRSGPTDYPPCGIKWDESSSSFVIADADENAPVTWVTFYGAQAYGKWLGAQLPTSSQHAYASRAGTNTYPWGNNLSDISSYAHVRAAAWQHAATEYNSRMGTLEETPPPAGAVAEKGFDRYKTKLDPAGIVHSGSAYDSAWPVSGAAKPNAWDLYDTIGNVWEWCRSDTAGEESVICGGSCLSPPEYAAPDSKYVFKARAGDVGLRVIAPAE